MNYLLGNDLLSFSILFLSGSFDVEYEMTPIIFIADIFIQLLWLKALFTYS
uniref:Uncharacterized protein n=1 Tax=Meloidogyne enterolobii TaxID=390850 RepID=A0A6V7TUK5_MELEN|nr:unnamed protein product [Meloidogyne enterolobii]